MATKRRKETQRKECAEVFVHPRNPWDKTCQGNRKIICKSSPVFSSVVRYCEPSVIHIHKIICVFRVNPQAVMIHVHAVKSSVGSASVFRDIQEKPHYVNFIFIYRISLYPAENPSVGSGKAFHIFAVLAYPCPCFSAVITSENSSAPYHTAFRTPVSI